MDQLSLHIIDIVENSIRAKANFIKINIVENTIADIFEIEIIDNGFGMEKESLEKAVDPFYTTRTTRKVGIGLSLLKQNAEMTGGSLHISSTSGKGTQLKATFIHSHIDRPPLGDMASVFSLLMYSNTEIHFEYIHKVNHLIYRIDSVEVIEALEETTITTPGIRNMITEMIRNNLDDLHKTSFGA